MPRKKKPKPQWMLTPRTCPYCSQPFLPKQVKQIYCRPSHGEMACRRRKVERGDVLNPCKFNIWEPGNEVTLSPAPGHRRCILPEGHPGNHLVSFPPRYQVPETAPVRYNFGIRK